MHVFGCNYRWTLLVLLSMPLEYYFGENQIEMSNNFGMVVVRFFCFADGGGEVRDVKPAVFLV